MICERVGMAGFVSRIHFEADVTHLRVCSLAGAVPLAHHCWIVTDLTDGSGAELQPTYLERDAVASYLSGAEEASEESWTRAHTEYLRRKDLPHAARCIFWLVLDLFNRGEWARGSGWLARGLRLLETEQDCASLGLLSVLASRQYLKQADTKGAAEAATRAFDLARQFDDPELAIFSRLALAQVKAQRGEFTGALRLFDEMMVSVTVEDVSPIAVGVAYCAVIDACRSLFDFSRAREWTSALSRWCAAQPDMVAFRGKCLVHRSEILRFSGDWAEALIEAGSAYAWSDAHPNSLKYPAGAASYELAEIHRLRGDFAAAEAAYRRASEHGQMPEPGLTLLRLAQGKPEIADATIRRLLKEQQGRVVRVAVLNAAVEILAGAGDVIAARAAADELAGIGQAYNAPALTAIVACSTGVVCIAEGNIGAALTELRKAWTLWQELDAPYEAARVRVLLGQVCLQLGDDLAAELELDTARRVFERLSAEPDIARVDALQRRSHTSGAGAGGMTGRELEVLELVAEGKTNRAIAEQLSISERTVDRHVSNILLKLHLPSRSAATAYAYQHDLIRSGG